MSNTTASQLADGIIIGVAFMFLMKVGFDIIYAISETLGKRIKRFRRNRLHDRWVAARVAAREATEEQMRSEGTWHNGHIQDAMDRAGREVHPTYHPMNSDVIPGIWESLPWPLQALPFLMFLAIAAALPIVGPAILK